MGWKGEREGFDGSGGGRDVCSGKMVFMWVCREWIGWKVRRRW